MNRGDQWRERLPQPGRPVPAGRVSRIRGRYQVPILRGLTWGLLVTSLVATAAPGPAGEALATAVVAAVVAAPLGRVAWLWARFLSERDRRFAVVTTLLLAVAAAGAGLVAAGVGR